MGRNVWDSCSYFLLRILICKYISMYIGVVGVRCGTLAHTLLELFGIK